MPPKSPRTVSDAPSPDPEPAWDRSVDVGFSAYIPGKFDNMKNKPSQAQVFRLNLVKYYLMHNHHRGCNDTESFFHLPASLRLQIWRHVLEPFSRARPVRMNPFSYTRDVFARDSFDSLEFVLAPHQGALNASFAFRADVLVAIFTTRHFHFVFSPYVGPTACPLATSFMRRYSLLMTLVTVELDFSRLGMGPEPGAANSQDGTERIAELAESFVRAQKQRRGFSTLEVLTIAARRYYGNRPVPNHSYQPNPYAILPYSGSAHEKAMEPLLGLRGLVDSARIVGTTEENSTRLIDGLFASMPADRAARDEHLFRRRPSTFYPAMPGSWWYVDYGRSQGVQRVGMSEILVHRRVGGDLRPAASLAGSSSLASVVEEEEEGSEGPEEAAGASGSKNRGERQGEGEGKGKGKGEEIV